VSSEHGYLINGFDLDEEVGGAHGGSALALLSAGGCQLGFQLRDHGVVSRSPVSNICLATASNCDMRGSRKE
jgi:hypothetical protein